MKSFTQNFTLAVSVQNFFNLILSETSSVKENFHVSLGDYDIHASEWRSESDNRFRRTFRFKRPTSTNPVIIKIMGKNVEVEEVLVYYFNGLGELRVESQSSVIGSSISSAFNSTGIWTVSPEGKDHCNCFLEVTNSCKAEKLPFYLRSFESVLENFMHDESISAYEKYITAIKDAIERNLLEQPTITQPTTVMTITNFENESEEKDESDTEDEYFDAEEIVGDSQETSNSGSVTKCLQKLCNDMDLLKEKLKQTQERLTTLEIRTVQSTQTVSDTVSRGYSQMNDVTQKLESQKFKDSLVLEKLESIDNTLHSAVIPRMIWGKNISLLFFLAVWPWVAFRAWALVRSFVFKK